MSTDFGVGYHKAVALLRRSNTENGFLASPTELANYRRIWSRDGSIMGLAALLTGDDELIACCRRTLETLVSSQGPHGEIPSNVDPLTDRVSYGGTAGRVDADLWFIIACSEYWRRTGDEAFLQSMLEPILKVRRLLGAWEFNNRGLIYVPPTGDWADEYLQSGYVLYDQLLYLEAQRRICEIHEHMHDSTDHTLEEKVQRLTRMIRANFWFRDDDEEEPGIYHRILYEKGRAAAPHRSGQFWMSFFTPFGYGYRYDAMANIFVSLLGVSTEKQDAMVDEFIDNQVRDPAWDMLPAFWPVITPKDEKWGDLQASFSNKFKNAPNEYHNGGLWPMVTGFYVASLARRNRRERAESYLEGLNRANALEADGEDWCFPEYIHGENHTPGGTHPLGWSAAGAIIGRQALAGNHVFAPQVVPSEEIGTHEPQEPAPGK